MARGRPRGLPRPARRRESRPQRPREGTTIIEGAYTITHESPPAERDWLWLTTPPQPQANGADHSEHAQAKALPFVPFSEINVDIKKPWIIKGVIARGETSAWIGGPGKGKSALVAGDLALHVACGWDWRGYRCKEKCAVIVLAFERPALVLRRLEACRRKHKIKGDLPIVVIRAPDLDIMQRDAVAILTDTIRAVERRFSLPVGLVIVDTFSKTLAYGGGDEDKAKDQNKARDHLRRVQEQTNVHFALIGHTGKDAARGERGSNAGLGDTDIEITITGDLTKTARVSKANDQAEGLLTSFTLETFDFGQDEDGDAITTSIVSADRVQAEKQQRELTLSPTNTAGLRALHECLADLGRAPPHPAHIPGGVTCVTLDEWREYLFKLGTINKEGSYREQFRRIRVTLKNTGLIGIWEENVWTVT
jgi:hypothetical protein